MLLWLEITFRRKKVRLTICHKQPTNSSPLLASIEVPLSYSYIYFELNAAIKENATILQSFSSFLILSSNIWKQTSIHLWKCWTHVHVRTGACTPLHAVLSQWRACHLEAPGFVSGVDSSHQSACSASCPSCRYTMQIRAESWHLALKAC